MSDVITQFLVGIGVKYDDTGQKKYEEGMSSLQSTTLRAGSVIASTLAAAGVVIDGNARHIARVNLEATRMSASSRYVLEYGAAVQRMGGNADDAIGQLQRMDQIMDDLHVRGQSGTLNELAQAGFNVSYLTQARNAQDLQERIANEYQHANSAQRRVASSVLGVDPATANLYAGGGDYLKEQVHQAGSLENITQDLIDKASVYNLQLRDSQTAWNGLVNTATEHYLPALTQVAKVSQSIFTGLDKFIQSHPQAADTVTTAATPALVGGAVGTGAAVAAKLGIPGAAGVARFAGPIGVAIGGGIYANQAWDHIESKSNDWYGADTTASGNLKKNSPLGKAWDFISDDILTPLRHNQASATGSFYNANDSVQDMRNINDNNTERQAKATSEALKASPVQVSTRVDAHLHMDGREIDTRIEQHDNNLNRNSVNINSAQVAR